jgi:hypothetical protein
MARLLHGETATDTTSAVEHLASCVHCRLRMQQSDPLRALFAESVPVVPAVHVPLPGAARWSLRQGRRYMRFAAGCSAVAAVAVLTLALQPHQGAPAPNEVARLTALIRTAAQRHDVAAIRKAVAEAQTAVLAIETAGGGDTSMLAELNQLEDQLESLPPDLAPRSVIAAVGAAIEHEGGAPAPEQSVPPASESPSPSRDSEVAPPSPTAEPTPDTGSTPNPAPTDTPGPTEAPVSADTESNGGASPTP